jgi:hypothetical protein
MRVIENIVSLPLYIFMWSAPALAVPPCRFYSIQVVDRHHDTLAKASVPFVDECYLSEPPFTRVAIPAHELSYTE